MRRRSFLFAAAAAISPVRKSFGQNSLGTLTWAQPDGLWIRELPDGPQKRIASGGGLRSPRFSPSGDWVAYQDGKGNVSVVRADGGNGAHMRGETCVWLPGESRIATILGNDAAVFGPSNAWVSPLNLWKDSGLPVASPDGQRFVAIRVHERPKDTNGLYQATAELYTASFAAPGKTEILLSNDGDIATWGWTRDGKSIVYWRASEWSASLWADGIDLYSLPLSGGPERRLGVSALHHNDLLDLAPKSVGNRLAATSSQGGRETWIGQSVTVVDLDTTVSRNLTSPDIAALCPAWSPDGRNVACFAAPAGDAEPHVYIQRRKIWILDPTGANAPRQLTGDPKYRDEAPHWSADGSHLLFGRMDYEGQASLWMMESSGANLKQICPLKIPDNLSDKDRWFGFYSYTDWRSAFDWRRI
jgi:dipeptidyl aminopeptidase/acylaminoacyl peptidase